MENTQMSEQIQSFINQWTKYELEHELIETGFSIRHVDELAESPTYNSLLEQSMKVLTLLINTGYSYKNVYKVGLIIPLISLGSKLALSIPNSIHELQSSMCSEPPSVYFAIQHELAYLQIIEEYKAPLSFDIFAPYEKQKNLLIYYREYRDEITIQHNWEFIRDIHLEYFYFSHFLKQST